MASIVKIFRLFLLVVPFVFMGCNDGDTTPEPPTQQLLKLTLGARYPTKDFDDWVMVHDKNGLLLGAKKFESGQVVTLETREAVPDDQISVTLMSVDSTMVRLFGEVMITLETYSGLSRGQEWNWSPGSPMSLTNQGEFTVDIDGVQSRPFAYAISNNVTGLTGFNYTNDSWMLHGSSMIFDQTTDFMVSLENDLGHPQYTFLKNVAAGQNYEFSVSDLQDFDRTLDVSFPATRDASCDLRTYDPSTRKEGYSLYVTYYSLNSPIRDGFNIGYLDQFQKYCLDISVGFSGKHYLYFKAGTLPKTVSFPFDLDFDIQNTGLNDFSLKANPAFAYRTSNYQIIDKSPSFHAGWTVHSPGAGFKFKEFPKELTVAYPMLELDLFRHTYTDFKLGLTYKDFVDLQVKETGPAEYEEYTVQVKK